MTPAQHTADPRRPRKWSRAVPGAALRGLALVALAAFVAFPEHTVTAGWEYDCGECFVDGGAGHLQPHVPVTLGRNDTYIGRGEVLVRAAQASVCHDATEHQCYEVIRRVSGVRPANTFSNLMAIEFVTSH